jgi:hypothetical protein
VWESTVEGQALTFELVGLNNQNFIMRDLESGSWWQQVTGRAIQGPLEGRQLISIPSETSTFGLWSGEHPEARVLAAEEEHMERYFGLLPQTREEETMIPFATPAAEGDPLERGAMVVGLEVGGIAKAYPMSTLLEQRTLLDRVGGRELLLVVGDDDETVRCFDRDVDGRVLEFFRRADTEDLLLVDKETGTEWSFAGEALSGELAGRRLDRHPLITEFWFDWRQFHPGTRLFAAGI